MPPSRFLGRTPGANHAHMLSHIPCVFHLIMQHAATPPTPPVQVHPIPLSDIKALRKHTPALGHHHVTLTLASGVSLPPLFFHNVSTLGRRSQLLPNCWQRRALHADPGPRCQPPACRPGASQQVPALGCPACLP